MTTTTLANLSMEPAVALRAIIESAIRAHPRSQQEAVGASEVGGACTRKLAHKLAGTPGIPAQVAQTPWRPQIGTAVHAWLEQAVNTENMHLGWTRWLTEAHVHIADYGGAHPLGGHCDLFDELTGTSIDWKIVGETTINDAKRDGPSPTYRAQAHLYGLGWRNAGKRVNTVAIYYLPMGGRKSELYHGYYWSEPFNEDYAQQQVQRLRSLIKAADGMNGWDYLIPLLPIAEDYCGTCPWWNPNATDLRSQCPGAQPRKPLDATGPAFGRIGKEAP